MRLLRVFQTLAMTFTMSLQAKRSNLKPSIKLKLISDINLNSFYDVSNYTPGYVHRVGNKLSF